MVLFYTGADAANDPQINADKSIGGFVSSTFVPNARLNNIFPDISKSAILENRGDIRLIALKNTTGAQVNNVTLFTSVANSSSVLSIAAVSSAINSCGDIVFEKVQDSYSLPYQATLAIHDGEVNALNVGNLSAGQVIGIWILRTIDTTKFPQFINQDTPLSCADLAVILEAQATVSGEQIELLIKWY